MTYVLGVLTLSCVAASSFPAEDQASMSTFAATHGVAALRVSMTVSSCAKQGQSCRPVGQGGCCGGYWCSTASKTCYILPKVGEDGGDGDVRVGQPTYRNTVMPNGVCNITTEGEKLPVPNPIRDNTHMIATAWNPNYGTHVLVVGRDTKIYHKVRLVVARSPSVAHSPSHPPLRG